MSSAFAESALPTMGSSTGWSGLAITRRARSISEGRRRISITSTSTSTRRTSRAPPRRSAARTQRAACAGSARRRRPMSSASRAARRRRSSAAGRPSLSSSPTKLVTSSQSCSVPAPAPARRRALASSMAAPAQSGYTCYLALHARLWHIVSDELKLAGDASQHVTDPRSVAGSAGTWRALEEACGG